MWDTCELWLIEVFRKIEIPIDMTEPRTLLPVLINALTRITGVSWQKQLLWAGEQRQNSILGHEKIYFITIKSNSCGADQDWRPFLFGCGVDCRHYLQPSPDMNTWYFFNTAMNRPSTTPGKPNWQLVEDFTCYLITSLTYCFIISKSHNVNIDELICINHLMGLLIFNKDFGELSSIWRSQVLKMPIMGDSNLLSTDSWDKTLRMNMVKTKRMASCRKKVSNS
jgi:hypothetical protein